MLWVRSEDDEYDAVIGEDGERVHKLEAIIRLEVRVKVNQEQKTFLYGTSDFFDGCVRSIAMQG